MMDFELTMLLWSVALAGLYLGVQSILYRVQYGVEYAATARDQEAPRNKWNGRAERALRNFMETYPVFVVLSLVIELSHRGSGLTAIGTHLWFWSRLAYLPFYMSGIPYVRSLIWCVSATGLALMFYAALFP